MIRMLSIVPAAILALMVVAGNAEEGTRQLFSCAGVMIEPAAISQSPKTIRLSIGPSRKVAVDLGQGNVNARVVSDNQIQLKFRTKAFVGELFHYTKDLFLIYHSGHLARMMCKTEG
jgi:hypothetical protein